MPRSRFFFSLLLILPFLPACNSSSTEPPSPDKRPVVGAMSEGDSGRIAASDFFVDPRGRVWINRSAHYTPRGLAPSSVRDTAWIGRIRGRLQVGFELTDPRHLEPRPKPSKGHWLQAHNAAAIVARLREGDYKVIGR